MTVARRGACRDSLEVYEVAWEQLPTTYDVVSLSSRGRAANLFGAAYALGMMAGIRPPAHDDVRLWPLDLVGRGKPDQATSFTPSASVEYLRSSMSQCDSVLLFDYSLSSIACAIVQLQSGAHPLVLLDPAHDSLPSVAFAAAAALLSHNGRATCVKPAALEPPCDDHGWIRYRSSVALQAVAIAEALDLPTVTVPHHLLDTLRLDGTASTPWFNPHDMYRVQTLNRQLAKSVSCQIANPLHSETPDGLVDILTSAQCPDEISALHGGPRWCPRHFCASCFIDAVITARCGWLGRPWHSAYSLPRNEWTRDTACAINMILMALGDLVRYSDSRMLAYFPEFLQTPDLIGVARDAASQILSQLQSDCPDIAALI